MRSKMAMGPRLAYWPKASSMNIKGKPTRNSITTNGIRKAPEKVSRWHGMIAQQKRCWQMAVLHTTMPSSDRWEASVILLLAVNAKIYDTQKNYIWTKKLIIVNFTHGLPFPMHQCHQWYFCWQIPEGQRSTVLKFVRSSPPPLVYTM